MLQRKYNYRQKVSCAFWRASFSLEQLEKCFIHCVDMYSWILSCCITGVATNIIDIRCTISVTVMFIMLCNTVQATFNVNPSIVHTNNA